MTSVKTDEPQIQPMQPIGELREPRPGDSGPTDESRLIRPMEPNAGAQEPTPGGSGPNGPNAGAQGPTPGDSGPTDESRLIRPMEPNAGAQEPTPGGSGPNGQNAGAQEPTLGGSGPNGQNAGAKGPRPDDWRDGPRPTTTTQPCEGGGPGGPCIQEPRTGERGPTDGTQDKQIGTGTETREITKKVPKTVPCTTAYFPCPGSCGPLTLPYWGRISGRSTHFRGRINEDARRLEVTITYTASDTRSLAMLTTSFRFDQNMCLIRNSSMGMNWGKEEVVPMVLKQGEQFHLRFKVQSSWVDIFCNGQKVAAYRNHIPICQLREAHVSGDCTLTSAGSKFSNIPLVWRLPSGQLETGQRIVLRGVTTGCSWSLNLADEDQNNCLLYFSPRALEREIVRSSFMSGRWGAEQRDGPCPFQMGKEFTFSIQNDPCGLRFLMNSIPFGEFKHHPNVNPDKDYNSLYIDGDVDVIRLEKTAAVEEPDSAPVLLKLRPLRAGDSFSVEGRINEDANKVDFNLYSSANPQQNALHVNPRFYENTTVMNSYLNSDWGVEEQAPLVFRKGEAFTLKVSVYATYFEISCNGKKLYKYKHRIPYDGLDRMVVNGDCTVLGSSSNERRDITLPLEMGFPGGSLKTNQSIILHGIPRGDRWTLELPDDDEDILFHFKALFKANAVIRNALFDGSWGKEEKEGPFPFKMGEPFSIVFQNTPYSFRITVNDELFGTFAHRTEDPKVDYKGMKVDGDIEVLGVDVE